MLIKVDDVIQHAGGSIWRVVSCIKNTVVTGQLLAYAEDDFDTERHGHYPIGTIKELFWLKPRLYTGNRQFPNYTKQDRICTKIRQMYEKRKEQGYAL